MTMTICILIAESILACSILAAAFVYAKFKERKDSAIDSIKASLAGFNADYRQRNQRTSDFQDSLTDALDSLNREDYLKLFLSSGVTYFVENRTWKVIDDYLICNPQPYAANKTRQIVVSLQSVMSYHIVTACPKPEADDKNEKATIPQNLLK